MTNCQKVKLTTDNDWLADRVSSGWISVVTRMPSGPHDLRRRQSTGEVAEVVRG